MTHIIFWSVLSAGVCALIAHLRGHNLIHPGKAAMVGAIGGVIGIFITIIWAIVAKPKDHTFENLGHPTEAGWYQINPVWMRYYDGYKWTDQHHRSEIR